MNAIEQLVRRADPDRYFSALFAPAAKRPHLLALYAFNVEIARVADVVREPMMGEIRLEWWRETLAGAREGRPRNHDVARALGQLFGAADLPADLFEAMIAARGFDASADTFADRASLEAYCDATSGNLMRLAARILGGADETAARAAGTAYAIAGMMRAIGHNATRHKCFLPQSLMATVGLTKEQLFAGQERAKVKAVMAQMAHWARERLHAARISRIRNELLPAFLPAALVPLFLRRLGRGNFDPFAHVHEVPIHRRQLRLLAAAMRRRL